MLKIVFSDTMNGAARAVLKELAGESGRRIVLVPDSHTLGVEKLVMEYTGLNATLDIEVTGIMRLAKRETGMSVLTKEGGVLLMKKVVNACRKQLVHYARAARAPGFAGEIFAAITSIRMNGVTPERLEQAIGELPDGATRRKNRDLVTLYRGYLEELKKAGCDGTMRAERFAAEIPSNPRLKGAKVFAFGFDSLSGIQIKILTELAAAGNVTVGLVRAYGEDNAELIPEDFAARLVGAAAELGVKTAKPVHVREKTAEPFYTLSRTIFSGSGRKVRDERGAVTLFYESDIFEEYNAVAREIARLVRREGYRYKDIAVIDAAPEHAKQLDEVFTRYRIPHFIDLRYPLKDTLPAKYISAIADMAVFNMRRDKVFRVLKNPLFAWDEREKFLFENYVLATNKDFGAFGEPFTGEGAPFEKLRRALTALAKPFAEKSAKAASYALAAEAMVSGAEYEDRLEACLEGADENSAISNRRAGIKILELLDEYVRLAGEEDETTEGFKQSFEAAVGAEELALIPRASDSVFVGKPRTGYIYRTRALFILNATQDIFPLKHDFLSIISAADSSRLEDAGVRLYPTPYDSMREEQFAIRDLLTKTDTLYIGYPMSYSSGINKPSGVISEISERLNKPVIRLSDRFSPAAIKDAKSLEDFVVTPENAVFGYLMYKNVLPKSALAAIEKALGKDVAALAKQPQGGEKVAGMLKKSERMFTSVSRIETFFRCPYAHYLRYALRLKEREEGKLRPVDVGLITHRVAERYFNRFKGRVHSTPRPTLDAAAAEIAAEEILAGARFGSAGASVATLKSLEKSLVFLLGKLTDNVLKGNYEPVETELQFGAGGAAPIKIGASFGDVEMVGKIDRVDVNDARVAVFDYKTGAAGGSPAEIYFGKKLQLAVYLKAAANAFGREPSGAFYVPLKDGYTASGKDFSYRGFMLGDVGAIKEFDSDAASSGEGFLPVRLKTAADGSLSAAASASALSAAQISQTLDYALAVSAGALEDIYRGEAGRKPLEKGCDSCVYAEVCAGRREYERAWSKDAAPFRRGAEKGE